MKAKRPTKAHRLSSTTINTLPQTIIENILCFLPIQEAARTSILSREWRYKWTTIPKLEFGSSTLSKGKNKEKLSSVIASARKNMDERYLYLRNVVIDHQPIFSGFGSLRSLCLYYVMISTKALLHLLSNCPSLKRFTLLGSIGHKDCTIIELFDCLHVIEDLTIYGYNAHQLVLDSVPEELSTSLIHLKYFCFKRMSLDGDDHLTFLAVLLKCSPNLEHIELEAETGYNDENEIYSGILEKYSDVWMEHLKELVIYYFNNSKPSMEFVKFIMSRSPKLKKVLLISSMVDEKDEELEMLKVLLQAPHASPVEIVVK
ncbi:putative F-box domain, leucine-rich repeat domain superfamily, F-box-like domain superfamily [Helianthus debilis subsp. tardiflorus]